MSIPSSKYQTDSTKHAASECQHDRDPQLYCVGFYEVLKHSLNMSETRRVCTCVGPNENEQVIKLEDLEDPYNIHLRTFLLFLLF